MGKDPYSNGAACILKAKYPELEIRVSYTILPYNDAREHMLEAMSNTNIDLISVDQIWLGEFAEKGYLTDSVIILRPGAELVTGMNLIWMGLFTKIKFLEYGHGLM